MIAASAPTASKRIECPRCGYDQRGVMATWSESCPLDGTCAECGLTFEWADIFDPLRAMPRWCVECDRGALPWPLQFVRTTIRACWPTALWWPLRMSHRHDWPRQVGYVLAWIVGVWIVIATCNGFVAYASASVNINVQRLSQSDPWSFALLAAVNPWDSELPYYVRRLLRYWPPLLGLLTVPLTTAIAFAALPVSRRRAKVRWWHVRRAAAYLFGHVGIVIALIIITRALGQNDLIYQARTPAASFLSHAVAIANMFAVVATVGVCVLLPFVVFWYWHACVCLHLRMEQPWAVALSVIVIGTLASCAIGYWAYEWLR